MTIDKILNDFGYLIKSRNYDTNTYEIYYSDEKKIEMFKESNFDMSGYNYDINAVFTVSLGGVEFVYGNLSVCLRLPNGDLWDVLEYKEEVTS